MTQVSKTLHAIADVLERDGWCRGNFIDPFSGAHCIVGALHVVVPDGLSREKVIQAIVRRAPTAMLYKLNDRYIESADHAIHFINLVAENES